MDAARANNKSITNDWDREMSRRPRGSERVDARVCVKLEDGTTGETRNLSPSGVFLVTDAPMKVGSGVRFSVEFQEVGGSFYLDCVGEIVRMESVEGKTGVGVRITQSRLERRAPRLPVVSEPSLQRETQT
jgi:hypothetical protein